MDDMDASQAAEAIVIYCGCRNRIYIPSPATISPLDKKVAVKYPLKDNDSLTYGINLPKILESNKKKDI